MKIPKILKNSTIYSIVTVLQKCASFFLLPLYTTFLTPADYGITGVVTSVSSLLAIFTTLGLDAAANRFYYKYKGTPGYASRLYGTIALVIIFNSLLFGGIFLAAHKVIIDPVIGEVEFYPYVFLGILNVIVTPLYLLFQGYLQTVQDGLKYGVNSMLSFIIQVALTIIFVAGYRMGALGVLLAQLITSVLFFIYVLFAFLRHLVLKVNKSILRESCGYSLPLLPHILANWSNGTIDRLLVNGIRSESDAGLYNLGRQYVSVMSTISVSINNAYVPWFYEKVDVKGFDINPIKRMSEVITFAVCVIGVFMSLFAEEVLDIMISNPAYSEVWKVIPFLISGVIFNSIYFFYVNVLFLKDTGIIFIITVSTIAINVGLNLLLIPLYGYIGCGFAVLITYFAKSVFAVILSMRRNKDIRLRTALLYTIGIVSSFVCISALLFEGLNIYLRIAIKLGIVLGSALIVFAVYKNDILELINHFRKKHAI